MATGPGLGLPGGGAKHDGSNRRLTFGQSDHFDLLVVAGTKLWAEGTLRQVTSAVGE
ncbi:hypothetical protein [Streptomyces virginiae]